ncbi:MAG: DNA-3-methyladenine glycosylase [Clostridium sp.]|uniref:DNA-3-methyladenine glycosylase n=1 Tax=Clostridium sp. TaxID=1506 RepID=UPI003F413DEF
MILNKEYFQKDSLTLAKDLLGKILVREIDGKVIKCKIVETESYIGSIDKACHAYNNKRTKRTEPLFHEGGVAYIYLIYGMYNCFNVISGKEDDAEGVLIRAIEPLNELDYLSNARFKKGYSELTNVQRVSIANGPGKLCMALNIDRDLNYKKLYEKEELYIINGEEEEFKIIETKRIGIDYAMEAKDFLWRFYIEGNKFISKK